MMVGEREKEKWFVERMNHGRKPGSHGGKLGRKSSSDAEQIASQEMKECSLSLCYRRWLLCREM
jgi:hypothetical protein